MYQIVRFLRFPSLVPYRYTPCQRPRTNQRWNNRSSPLGEIRTKDEHKNSQTQKSTFIKIAISFPFLIPCPILPREHRPTTERTPTQLPVTKKCFFLRLLPNKVVLIPEKVDSHPEKVDSCPNMIDSLP